MKNRIGVFFLLNILFIAIVIKILRLNYAEFYSRIENSRIIRFLITLFEKNACLSIMLFVNVNLHINIQNIYLMVLQKETSNPAIFSFSRYIPILLVPSAPSKEQQDF